MPWAWSSSGRYEHGKSHVSAVSTRLLVLVDIPREDTQNVLGNRISAQSVSKQLPNATLNVRRGNSISRMHSIDEYPERIDDAVAGCVWFRCQESWNAK